MSFFNGRRLRELREDRRLSMASVRRITGISESSISNIETGKTDPRMSTVATLLSCYGASLSDLEPAPTPVVSLEQLKQRSAEAAEDLELSGFGLSDPAARLARKAALGLDTSVERSALLTRS